MARILVAEDHADIRELLATMLEGAGYAVLPAADGKEALQVFAAERPDLVIVDIFMPRVDGIEVIRTLRRDPACPPIVAVSSGWRVPNLSVSYPEYDVLDEARALGAAAALAKPVEREHLLALVQRLLAERGAGSAGGGAA